MGCFFHAMMPSIWTFDYMSFFYFFFCAGEGKGESGDSQMGKWTLPPSPPPKKAIYMVYFHLYFILKILKKRCKTSIFVVQVGWMCEDDAFRRNVWLDIQKSCTGIKKWLSSFFLFHLQNSRQDFVINFYVVFFVSWVYNSCVWIM